MQQYKRSCSSTISVDLASTAALPPQASNGLSGWLRLSVTGMHAQCLVSSEPPVRAPAAWPQLPGPSGLGQADRARWADSHWWPARAQGLAPLAHGPQIPKLLLLVCFGSGCHTRTCTTLLLPFAALHCTALLPWDIQPVRVQTLKGHATQQLPPLAVRNCTPIADRLAHPCCWFTWSNKPSNKLLRVQPGCIVHTPRTAAGARVC